MGYQILLNLSGNIPAYTDNTIVVGTNGTVHAHVNGQVIECQRPFEFTEDQVAILMPEITKYLTDNGIDVVTKDELNGVINVINQTIAANEAAFNDLAARVVTAETDPIATAALAEHIAGDETRWTWTQDQFELMRASILSEVQKMILGTSLPLDYSNPQTVIGTNGLLSLATGNSWTVPFNGAIVCSAGGALTTSVSVIVMNGSTVVSTWVSPTYVLGLPLGGDKSPSDPIPVSATNTVTTSGLISVGSPINVTYYSNKV